MTNIRRLLQSRFGSSLRVRVALPFIAISTIILIILYFVVGAAAERTQIRNMEQNLQDQAEIASLSLSAYDLGTDQNQVRVQLDAMAETSNTRITVVDGDGKVLYDSVEPAGTMENHADRPEILQARDSDVGIDRRTSDSTGTDSLYVAVPVHNSDGVVMRVAVPTTAIPEAVAPTQQAILWAVVGSIVATGAASWYFAGRLSRPLEDLMRQAMRMAVGDFSVRAPDYEIREIHSVGRAFNRMANRLEDLIERQEQTSLRLELVLSGLIDGVVLTDEQGLVLRMNPAAEMMLSTLR